MIPIEDVELNVDNIIDKVIMGPQAEVLTKVNNFNETWNANIGVTKTFRWSPGIYDEVKRILNTWFLGWDRKASKMETLFNRMENATYQKRRITSGILDIDRELFGKRAEGLVFQENKEEIKEALDVFLDRLVEFKSYSHKYVEVEIEIIEDQLDHFNNKELRDLEIHFDVYIQPQKMSVNVWDHDTLTQRHIAELATPYELILKYEFSFVKWFNRFCNSYQNGRDITNVNNLNPGHTPSTGQGYVNDLTNNENDFINFPYISNAWNRGRRSGSVCLGDLQETIFSYLFNLNNIMYYDTMYKWATTFIVHKSNPYNQIKFALHGHPKQVSSTDMVILNATTDPNHCRYPGILWEEYEESDEDPACLQDTHCDRTECLLRDRCTFYQEKILGDIEAISKLKPVRLQANQRTAALPSWMQENENGVLVDIREIQRAQGENETGTVLPVASPTVDTPDMQVESEMVSNDQPISDVRPFDPEAIAREVDGGEVEDRDGEREMQALQRAWLRNRAEDMARMAGESSMLRDRFTISDSEENQSVDESDNVDTPF